MRFTSIILLSASLTVFAGEPVAGPDPFAASDPSKSASRKAAGADEGQVFGMKFMIEQSGEVVESFTAFASAGPDSNHIYCTGAVSSSDGLYWRVSIEAAVRDLEEGSSIEVDVTDLKLRTNNSDGAVIPIEIFSVRQRSKGMGKYTLGEIQGMTLKMEISKAGQDGAAQPSVAPEVKPEAKENPKSKSEE